jgi:hypothetical protein
MLKVVNTSVLSGYDPVGEVTVLHKPVYVLHCQDSAENQFEIETDKETYVQVTDFLDKLRTL